MNSNPSPNYREPTISVDRQTKKLACFDGFDCVRGFQAYENEADALREAYDWFTTRTIHVPQVVYPRISKFKMS